MKIIKNNRKIMAETHNKPDKSLKENKTSTGKAIPIEDLI